MGLSEAYAVDMKNFVGNYLIMFFLGALLGQVLSRSGAARMVAVTLAKKFGSKNALLITVVTASASGAIGIIISTQGEYLLSLGISAEAIHRVLATASTLLPNLPHSGVVIALLSLAGLSHKEAYKHVFLAPLLVGVFGLVTTMLLS